MIKYIFVALVMFFSIEILAQDIIEIPAQAIGTGNIISISPHDDVSSMNPALMAKLNSYGALIAYTLPYSLSDFQQMEGKFVGHTKVVNITGRISRNGNENSSFTQFGAGLSREFHHFGIGIEYYGILHQLAFSQHAFSSYSRIGLFFSPDNKWLFSLTLHNIEQRTLHYNDALSSTKIDPMIAFSFRWDPYDFFSILAEMEKRFSTSALGKGAVSIHLIDRTLDINAGYSSAGNSLCLGIAYQLKFFAINVAMNYHNRLGISSGVAFTFAGDDLQKTAN